MAKKFPNSRHFLTYRHSLKTYASILYLRIPSGFRMILRGKEIEHHNIVNDMMMKSNSTYRPQPQPAPDGVLKDPNMVAVVTMGLVKDEKDHIDVQGFNIYHKNQLKKISITETIARLEEANIGLQVQKQYLEMMLPHAEACSAVEVAAGGGEWGQRRGACCGGGREDQGIELKEDVDLVLKKNERLMEEENKRLTSLLVEWRFGTQDLCLLLKKYI